MKSLVSVVMITYGHERFIEKSIEGVFMQIVNFDLELIISNDNSPDNSDELINNIIKRKPENITIKYTKQLHNLGMSQNFIWTLKQCTGKYIALCEGDDFWVDPLKLQKQVDFLEQNSGYSLCCSNYITNLISEKYIDVSKIKKLKEISQNSFFEFNQELNLKFWLTKSLTLVFRNYGGITDFLSNFKYARDIHLNYFLLSKGKGGYIDEIFGLYNIHEGGVFSSKDKLSQIESNIPILDELYSITNDKRIRSKNNNLKIKKAIKEKRFYSSISYIKDIDNLLIWCKILLK